MMISPMTYEDMHLNDSYEELIKERNYLIKEIKHFEKNKEQLMQEAVICPTPDVVYQMNLEYLARLCSLICQKYREGECDGYGV